MKAPGGLGEFLQARRSRLRPEDIGLAAYGDRRRVPGLRHEEVALLAGVSSSYCTRLEQGWSQEASPEILNAIARAFGLDESECRHLPGRRGTARPDAAQAAARARQRRLASSGWFSIDSPRSGGNLAVPAADPRRRGHTAAPRIAQGTVVLVTVATLRAMSCE